MEKSALNFLCFCSRTLQIFLSLTFSISQYGHGTKGLRSGKFKCHSNFLVGFNGCNLSDFNSHISQTLPLQ